jgi:predicted nucleic acid-binding protein
MKRIRVYIDTSVVGGCFDEEFAKESRAVILAARDGRFVLLLSDLLADELASARPQVQNSLANLPAQAYEEVFGGSESERLRDAYLQAHVVGPRHAADAEHIALATASRADLLVSWNFKHIVHWDKIRRFNAINTREGYPPLEIRSPQEVI